VGGTFLVVDDHTVAYLDITASGAETIAHLRENGRITLMFCSFGRAPNVVRLHGTGRVVSLYDAEYGEWAPARTWRHGRDLRVHRVLRDRRTRPTTVRRRRSGRTLLPPCGTGVPHVETRVTLD
jgi:hypothetical protein